MSVLFFVCVCVFFSPCCVQLSEQAVLGDVEEGQAVQVNGDNELDVENVSFFSV